MNAPRAPPNWRRSSAPSRPGNQRVKRRVCPGCQSYPVLVVHDERLGVPGSGKFLNDESKSLLGTVPSWPRRGPSTIVTMAAWKPSKHPLLGSDCAICSVELRPNLRTGCAPYTQFMATSSYATKLKASKRVVEASEGLMRRMQDALFPKEALQSRCYLRIIKPMICQIRSPPCGTIRAVPVNGRCGSMSHEHDSSSPLMPILATRWISFTASSMLP